MVCLGGDMYGRRGSWLVGGLTGAGITFGRGVAALSEAMVGGDSDDLGTCVLPRFDNDITLVALALPRSKPSNSTSR